MSFSLKREIEFYVNDVDSTDGVCKIPIMPEFDLEIQANLLQVFRKIVSDDPEMLPRSVVDQISPVVLGFMTYLKPAQLDGEYGVTAPEKLFWDSLGGIQGYRGSEYYKPQFGRVNRLLPLYIFIKTTTAIYKIGRVYVDSVEISFDINYLLVAKWTAQAIDFDSFSIDEISFTNVKDYTNIDSYIRNKFTKLTIQDSKDGKEYQFPITESKLKIQNVLMPVYDKNVKVITATVKDLIVGGRSVTGEFSCYLSSRFKHSRDFIDTINEDLTQVNRKYKLEYICEDENNKIEFLFPYAIINVPNIKFDDVLTTTIQFTSSESDYGRNDDTDIRYYKQVEGMSYDDFISYVIDPEYYYKLNESSGNTIYNYGNAGAAFNLTNTQGTLIYNQSGPYLNSKGLKYSTNDVILINTASKPLNQKIFVSMWMKATGNNFAYFFRYVTDISDYNYRVIVGYDPNADNFYFTIGNSTFNDSIAITLNRWYHIALVYDHYTKKLSTYRDGVKRISNATPGTTSISGNEISLGYASNYSDNWIFSEVMISLDNDYLMNNADTIVSKLYNITDINNTIDVTNIIPVLSDYENDVEQTYIQNSNLYYNTVKSYGPKAYWRFNDNNSTQALDHITGAYPLTLNNNPGLGGDSPILNDSSSKSAYFGVLSNGTYQYTTSSAPISTSGKTKFTFAFWVYLDANSLSLDGNDKICLIKSNSNTGNNCLTLLHRNGGNGYTFFNGKMYYNFDLGYGAGSYNCTYHFDVYIGIPLKEWTFIVYTIDTSTNNCRMYRNGQYVTNFTNANLGTALNNNTIALEIGKRTYNYKIPIKITEFAYFEKVLSEESIKGIYAASGITGFNYTILPTKKRLNIPGNITNIVKGKIVIPIKNQINISGNSLYARSIRNIRPSKSFPVFIYGKFSTIKKIYKYNVLSSELDTYGNVCDINVVKIVIPTKSRINVEKYIPTILHTIFANNRTLSLVNRSEIIILDNIRIIYVTKGETELQKYSPKITNLVKVYKPRCGKLSFGYPTNFTPAYGFIMPYYPLIYYKFNENSGTTLTDYSLNGRNATLYNTPSLNQIGPHGGNSKSIYFSKASLQHAIYNSSLSIPTKGSIAFWVKMPSHSNYDHLFQFNYAYNAGNNVNYFKMIYESSTSSYWIMPFGTSYGSTWQMSLSDNVWTHVAITWDKSTNKISTYKNGTVISNDGTHSNWPTSLQPLGICRGNRDGTTYYHNAYIAEFVLFNNRLSSAEVAELYNKSTISYAADFTPWIYQYSTPNYSTIKSPIIFI